MFNVQFRASHKYVENSPAYYELWLCYFNTRGEEIDISREGTNLNVKCEHKSTTEGVRVRK